MPPDEPSLEMQIRLWEMSSALRKVTEAELSICFGRIVAEPQRLPHAMFQSSLRQKL